MQQHLVSKSIMTAYYTVKKKLDDIYKYIRFDTIPESVAIR